MATSIPDIQSPIGELSSPTQDAIHRFTHIHPVTAVVDGDGEFKCHGCKTHASGKIYRCSRCSYDYHYHCASCPFTLRTSMHPEHELELGDMTKWRDRLSCIYCYELIEGLFYWCRECYFYVHPLCTSESQHPVYISFHRNTLLDGLVSHLAKTLISKGFLVYAHSDEREVPDLKILFKRIEKSRVALVILSNMYTDSNWRMAELVKIMNRARMRKLVVIPIFYNMDMNDVKYQKGVFGHNSWNLKSKGYPERYQWSKALESFLNIQGFTMDVNSDVGLFIGRIVIRVMISVQMKTLSSQARKYSSYYKYIRQENILHMFKEDIWAQSLITRAITSVEKAVFCANTFPWNKTEESITPLRSTLAVREEKPLEDKPRMEGEVNTPKIQDSAEINFRGEEIRYGFVSQLVKALKSTKIRSQIGMNTAFLFILVFCLEEIAYRFTPLL